MDAINRGGPRFLDYSNSNRASPIPEPLAGPPVSAHRGRMSWKPSLTAVVIALLMLWLAGGPFEADPEAAAPAPGLSLVEPLGTFDSFPTRFEWTPEAGVDGYEIFVTPADPGAAPLFRQRGRSTLLELEIEEGKEPAPGAYVWEVLALTRGRAIARAEGHFLVNAAP